MVRTIGLSSRTSGNYCSSHTNLTATKPQPRGPTRSIAQPSTAGKQRGRTSMQGVSAAAASRHEIDVGQFLDRKRRVIPIRGAG